MSQVIIEFAVAAATTQDLPIAHWGARSAEITSSGTSQATAITASNEVGVNIVTVINNGTDAIWVDFGRTATAASPSRFVPPNTIRDFGNVPAGVTVSVINDS